jgi:hypothetical protein
MCLSRLLFFLCLPLITVAEIAKEAVIEFKSAPHLYLEHQPTDRFTALLAKVNAGEVIFDTSDDKAFLTSILKALDIPVSSQLQLFSATSLQSEIINPRNPRALYFNEDTYLGYVAGGKVEVISMDPTHAAIFRKPPSCLSRFYAGLSNLHETCTGFAGELHADCRG